MTECICVFDGNHPVPEPKCTATQHVPTYRELLLGCGYARRKIYVAQPGHPAYWQGPKGPTTLDINLDCQPDIWCDLNGAPPWHGYPRVDPELGAGAPSYSRAFRMEESYWDEIHAYQVLEHLGRLGDAASFFAQLSELHRILKPGGYLVASVPSRFGEGFWGDPSHARAIVPMHLSFLDQTEYVKQCDGLHPTGMSDFRHIYKSDFRVVDHHDNRTDFVFILQAVKPSRWAPRKPKEVLESTSLFEQDR